ncbi:Gfo/Idh/MocA family oxidoreductase [Actinopolyspora sp. H202]|uniref:Gfo/Idh/MocA family oxidoreductase n=1 Tax=Actinopolyspora sp. H202 TaxID=1500456 RepID=UPI003EE5AE04
MDSEGRFRVGLFGYGLAGSAFHAPLIAAQPRLRLDAVVTSSGQRAEQVVSRYPEARVHSDATELFRRADEMDLLVIATPNSSHAELTARALDAGVPVVVDKPFTPTAEEARELISRAEDRGVPLTVFQNRRWDNDMLTVRELLDSDSLGRVHRFESRFERWVPVAKDSWRDQGGPGEAGGVLYDLGSHLIDQALCLFGDVESVYAEMDTIRPDVAADDDTFLALRHTGGQYSHLWVSKLAAQQGPRFRVLGDRAAFTKYGLDPQEAALRQGSLPGEPGWGEEPRENWGSLGVEPETRPWPSRPGRYQDFYAGVVRTLESGVAPPVDPADALRGLEVIEAARRSVADGSVVTLPRTR